MCCAALPVCGHAFAQDFFDIPVASLPSSVTLEGGGDAESRSLSFRIDAGVPSGMRIRGGYEAVRVDSANLNYTDNTFWAGLNSDPLDVFSYGANYEAIERNDGIHSSAVKANLRWRLNDWRIALYPQLRMITLKKNNAVKNKIRRMEITSPGLGIAVTFNGLESWSFAFRHFVYRYETDAQALRRYPAFAQRAASRIEQSFDASNTGISADRTLSWGSVGAEAMRSLSAVDHVVARSVAVNLNWEVSPAWMLSAHFGRSRADGSSVTGFASVGVNWMWDE